MEVDHVGVHRTHCCFYHGCKYGEDKDCPVCTGEVKQEFPCEICDSIDNLYEIVRALLIKEYKNSPIPIPKVIKVSELAEAWASCDRGLGAHGAYRLGDILIQALKEYEI